MDTRNPPMKPQQASPTGVVVNYEVHVLYEGRWLIEQSGSDEAAMAEYAKEIARRREAGGVRLIREIHSPAEERSAFRVLFERISANPPPPDDAGAGRSSKATHRG